MEVGVNLSQVTYFEEVLLEESKLIVKRKDVSIFGKDKGYVWDNISTLKSYPTPDKAIENSGISTLYASEGKVFIRPHVVLNLSDGSEFKKYFFSRADLAIFVEENLSHCIKLEV